MWSPTWGRLSSGFLPTSTFLITPTSPMLSLLLANVANCEGGRSARLCHASLRRTRQRYGGLQRNREGAGKQASDSTKQAK